jgi:leucyl-tRNA synthetase
MELVNEVYAFTDKVGLTKQGRLSGAEAAPATRAVLAETLEALVLMLSPFTPHLAEELWELLGHSDGVVAAGWPTADAAVAAEEAIVVPVQVNGKLRGRVSVPVGADEAAIEAAALAEPNVQAHTAGKTIVKVVVAKGRLVSIVVK